MLIQHSPSRFSTPVVLIVFNRPEETQRLLDRIRSVKPKTLFVIADGPRTERPSDIEKTYLTRRIVNNIDWDCELVKIFAEHNLGCKQRVSSGLTEVFQRVDKAIILEDDCLPHPSFFEYCRSLLNHYENDTRIWSIGGSSLIPFPSYRYTYKLSKYTHFWGWASWARAWRHYPDAERRWLTSENREELISKWCDSQVEMNFWKTTFDNCTNGKLSSWGYLWMLAGWLNNGLNIVPKQNLISNIGFGQDATHTINGTSMPLSKTSIGAIAHPAKIQRDKLLDTRLTVEIAGADRRLLKRITSKAIQLLGDYVT